MNKSPKKAGDGPFKKKTYLSQRAADIAGLIAVLKPSQRTFLCTSKNRLKIYLNLTLINFIFGPIILIR